MSGGRLLAIGPLAAAVGAIAARLTASGWRTGVLSLAAAADLSEAERPEVALFPLPAATTAEEPAGLLAAWADTPTHIVLLSEADRPCPDGVMALRGLDADGLIAFLDVLAERDRARQAEAEAAAWRDGLLRAFPGAIMVTDASYQVRFVSGRLRERLREAPAGKACFALLHGRTEPCPWCPRERLLRGETAAVEVQSPLDDLFLKSVSTVLALPGQPPLVLSFLFDVTNHQRTLDRLIGLARELEHRVAKRTGTLARQAEALSAANARLIELDVLKSGFLATVTHDLRTPLTSVLGFAKLARRDFVKEFMPFADVSPRLTKKGMRIAENLRIIENEGARLTRLVNDFLDLSKIEAGRLDWHDRLVAPCEVVRMAVEAVSGEYEQNERLVLVVDVAARLPPLLVDPDRLMQVLVNLLINAARYAREGDVSLSARQLSPERLEFRVTDTGPGIPEDERERIFDKFHQVQRGDTTAGEHQGTGLGLAICKYIVERYGGGIRAEANAPQGTAFVVELPVPPDTTASGSDPEADRPASNLLLS